jgi:UDP-glucose 4-epimerase
MQTRTFTYVKDVVQGLSALMACSEAAGEVFNIGGTEEITILALARRIIQETGSASTVQLIPYEQAYAKDFEDMQRRVPSIEKIRERVGFHPVTDLGTILRKVIDYQRQR